MPNQPDLDPTVVIPLPQRTLAALDALENAGFETWIVGGYVRDALLGRPSSDIDIATQAHWQDVQRVFEGQGYRTHETGTAHGTLTVIVDEQALEVTTYRSDGAYADARHPNQVSFVRTIAEDLARRDFTMNALAYHPARGLFDPYGGHADLEAQIIRAVGDPDRRFSEDAGSPRSWASPSIRTPSKACWRTRGCCPASPPSASPTSCSACCLESMPDARSRPRSTCWLPYFLSSWP